MNSDDLTTVLRALERIMPPITKDELALAHVACPQLYEMHRRMCVKIEELSSQLAYQEEREYKLRIDAEEARREYGRTEYEY